MVSHQIKKIDVKMDPIVSERKIEEEVRNLLNIEDLMKRRGWEIKYNYPEIFVTFNIGGTNENIPFMMAHINASNYDLIPLSVHFLDPNTRHPLSRVQSIMVRNGIPQFKGGRPLEVVVHDPPRLPFLCVPGIREYHLHPQHDNDPWHWHRYTGEGKLFTVIDNIWVCCIKPAFEKRKN